jgi:hypothetical protein
MSSQEIGRNDPCSCGSGKKFKKCCFLKGASQSVEDVRWARLRQTEGHLVHTLLEFAVKRFGKGVVFHAWEEFTHWQENPPSMEESLEFETMFMPWFLFHWMPDEEDEEWDGPKFQEETLAFTYLKENGSQLSDYEKRFCAEAAGEPFSYFQVLDIEPGVSISLKDIFLDREVKVRERRASTQAQRGDILYTQVVSLDGVSVMLGCAPMRIPPRQAEFLLTVREELEEDRGALNRRLLEEFEFELREIYYEYVDLAKNPPKPILQNTDGDPLVFVSLKYRLTCSVQEAYDRLFDLTLEKNPEIFLGEDSLNEQGDLTEVSFPWNKKGNKRHESWEKTTLGQLSIEGDVLSVEVNSENRVKRIEKLIQRRLEAKGELLEKVTKTPDEYMADEANVGPEELMKRQAAEEENRRLNEIPEVQAHLRAMNQKHWESWLDSKLPALNNETPREAAQTKEGRRRLDALFLQFERRIADAQNPLLAPNLGWIKQQLKMG